MPSDVIKRFVLLISLAAAILSLAVNLALGRNLLFSAFWACCVMFGVAIILFFSAQTIAKILMAHLFEQRRLKEEEELKERKRLKPTTPER